MNSVEYGNETDSEVYPVSCIVPSPVNTTFKINGKRDNEYIQCSYVSFVWSAFGFHGDRSAFYWMNYKHGKYKLKVRSNDKNYWPNI